SSLKTRAQLSSSLIPPAYITGAGVDKHAIENTLVLGPYWFGHVSVEMAELIEKDDEGPLCFQSASALASHSWVSKNLSRSFPSSEHMLFLVYWLNRFVFPNRSSTVLLEYRHLAEALHNHTDVGLGPTVLAHLFKNLHTTTLENPLNLSVPGAFWMIQIWLQVYFTELRFPDVILPED
ncbi:unnamed protein product, partial [Prunus brigantina]